MEHNKFNASAWNRIRVTSMATMYSATRPPMLLDALPVVSTTNDVLALGKVTCN